MAVFEYRGIFVGTGKPAKGVRDAENAKALRGVLKKDGILLTSATEEKAAKEKKKRSIQLFAFIERPSTSDVAVMTRQLATLLRAGIPLFESLNALIEQVENEMLRNALTNVREQVREGISFAKALEAHPVIFPTLYVNMVRAGEASGTLETVLERLTSFMENQSKLVGKVTSALAYPILMLLIGSLLIGVLMVAVVPNLVTTFAQMDQALPWYTQLLIFTSGFMGSYWWAIVAFIVIAIFTFRRWKRTTAGRMQWDRFTLAVPVIGKLIQMLCDPAFRADAVDASFGGRRAPHRNGYRARRVEQRGARKGGRRGDWIDPRRSIDLGTVEAIEAVSADRHAYDRRRREERSARADARKRRRCVRHGSRDACQVLTSLLEPLIIVIMGGAVAFIAFSILMPLIQMSSFAG